MTIDRAPDVIARPDLRPMLSPDTIAIVGASADPRTIRGRILEYLIQRRYAGKIYLVSATQREIRGHETYATLSDVPEPIDLVLIAVPADVTPAILDECSRLGTKFAICYSSGFAESGDEGVELQNSLTQFARSGPRICGPNTAGFFNVKGGVPATFARNVDAGRAPIVTHRSGAAPIAIVAQSGGLGFAMNDRCASAHGMLAGYVVSTGNEVDLETTDFVDFMLDDPDIRVVLLLVEAIKDGARLKEVAGRAMAAGKPIIVSKFGSTEAGSRAVGSHAGRLTGSDAVYDAVLRRHGLIRVGDEDEMTDLAAAFSACPLPEGRRVGILTTSGGAGVWLADACETQGLTVPLLDDATQAALADYVPSFGAIQNPVDMTAQASVNPEKAGTQVSTLIGSLRALHDSPSIDAVVLVANMSDGALLARERDGLIDFAAKLQKPLFLYSHAPPSAESLRLIEEIGLVCLATTTRTARTIAHMADYADMASRGAAPGVPVPPIAEDDRARLAGGLCEYEAKALLKRYGIAVTDERLARSAEEAVAIAAEFGVAVALKVQSREIAHKTEVGGVVIGLTDAAEISAAHDAILARSRRAAPAAMIDGVLVQKMQAPGHELALGIVHDETFGHMMMVALGGIFIEVMKDVVLEPLPIDRARALSMLRRLKAWPLLNGARGKPPADVEALTVMMEQLSRMVEGADGACREIDINPVFVSDAGQGAVAVDAIVIGRDEIPAGGQH